jgi:glucan phosphoethanolaminetransferase (alkaline phosphatase superfamily)
MSSKSLAVGTAVVLVVFLSCIAFYTAIQYINPVAIVAAVVVAVIGMAWFKKSVT